jgi:hypothetical protein
MSKSWKQKTSVKEDCDIFRQIYLMELWNGRDKMCRTNFVRMNWCNEIIYTIGSIQICDNPLMKNSSILNYFLRIKTSLPHTSIVFLPVVNYIQGFKHYYISLCYWRVITPFLLKSYYPFLIDELLPFHIN